MLANSVPSLCEIFRKITTTKFENKTYNFGTVGVFPKNWAVSLFPKHNDLKKSKTSKKSLGWVLSIKRTTSWTHIVTEMNQFETEGIFLKKN